MWTLHYCISDVVEDSRTPSISETSRPKRLYPVRVQLEMKYFESKRATTAKIGADERNYRSRKSKQTTTNQEEATIGPSNKTRDTTV